MVVQNNVVILRALEVLPYESTHPFNAMRIRAIRVDLHPRTINNLSDFHIFS